MKVVLFLIFVTVLIEVNGQTQVEMNNLARERKENAEEELNNLLAEIKEKYSTDTIFLEKLNYSQEIWQTYKTAELRLKYPPRDPGYYGSNYSMCLNIYLTDLINNRIDHLSQWVTGAEPGDGCRGSVKEN